jgi:hypothetical protein
MENEELAATLRRTNDRLKALVEQSMQRVLAGSTDRTSMEAAYSALRGEAGAAEGVAALRRALVADGLTPADVSNLEALYLNVLVGV